jgi:uncharacterized membrane protein YebE (DUF533 family)
MAEEFLGTRKRALEEEFFRRRERELLARIQAEQARQSARQALAEASGLTDPAVLDHLVALGIAPETLLALRLVPLVEVAWADGHLDDRERRAVLSALSAAGLAPGSAAYALVESWLASPPPPALLEAWTGERAQLRDSVLRQARAVAEAAGGFLGLGRISDAEAAVLRRLEAALAD